MKDSLKIAIAGATGYIGLEFVATFLRHAHGLNPLTALQHWYRGSS